MRRVVLIHPPGTDPRSPRLALPTLAAYLRSRGVEAQLVDLDLESLLALLSRESLSRAAGVLRGRASSPSDHAGTRLAVLAEGLPEDVPAALDILRDPRRFFDPHAHSAARATLLDGLDLLSAASPRPLHWSLEPLRYDVDGVDATRLADLARVTADREANLFADFWEQGLLADLEHQRPTLVGISIATRHQLLPALMLARSLRQRGHFVAVGGTVPTRFASRLAQLPEFFALFADAVVIGDGESALVELVDQVEGVRDLTRVPNCLYAENGRVRFTRAHLEDLAELPTPHFAGLPLDRYLVPERVLPVLFGRGCYYNECRFCEIPHNNRISAKPFRLRPTEQLVTDVLALAERWDCRHFVIGDEAVPARVLQRFVDGLHAAGRDDLRFEAYLRFEPRFTPDLCRHLARGGLRRVLLGLESGCQETLDHMRKGIRLENVEPMLSGLHAAGVCFTVFGLVGLPEETEDSARATFEFFERHAALFARPGNGHDIRPLELQTATEYMAQADKYGLRLPAEALAGDFVMGIGRRWENSRGLSQSDVDRLFAEYGPRLAALDGDIQHWTVWDEWGLLYAEHYCDRPYRYRRALPDPGDAQRILLRFSPTVAFVPEGADVRLLSRERTMVLSRASCAALGGAGAGTSSQIVARLGGVARDAGIRAFVAILARAGLLEIVPLDDEDESVSLPSAASSSIHA